jgi:hypothetical protein
MPDFNTAAVRFGKPGKLYIAALGTAEPSNVSSAWNAAFVCLGYTEEGSTFTSELSTEDVSVAEELDPIAVATIGRVTSVNVALAELTHRNLSISLNGGTIITPDGQNWTFEPPTTGTETRYMLGWDASAAVATNDLRMLFRRVLTVGNLDMGHRKGAAKATLSVTFRLEKPADGVTKPFKVWGSGVLNPV